MVGTGMSVGNFSVLAVVFSRSGSSKGLVVLLLPLTITGDLCGVRTRPCDMMIDELSQREGRWSLMM